MHPPSLEPQAPGRLRRPDGPRGFTLLELSLSLLVAVLAAALLLAGLARWRQRTRCAELGRDLQAFAAIIEKARSDRGHWPQTADEAGPGLQERGWSAASPLRS